MTIQITESCKVIYLLNEKSKKVFVIYWLQQRGKNWNKWRGLRRVLTNIMGICEISWPLSSLITAQIGRSSSRLCREHTEYTKMKAWPLLMESRCIAGNWWDPVVSVIWSVHMFLSQLITWNIVMQSVGFDRKALGFDPIGSTRNHDSRFDSTRHHTSSRVKAGHWIESS